MQPQRSPQPFRHREKGAFTGSVWPQSLHPRLFSTMFPWQPKDGCSSLKMFSNFISWHPSLSPWSSNSVAGSIWLFSFHSLENPNSFLPQDFRTCCSLCLKFSSASLPGVLSPIRSHRSSLRGAFLTLMPSAPASPHSHLTFLSDTLSAYQPISSWRAGTLWAFFTAYPPLLQPDAQCGVC